MVKGQKPNIDKGWFKWVKGGLSWQRVVEWYKVVPDCFAAVTNVELVILQ